MNEQSYQTTDDELSLIEVVDFFREGWKQIVVSGIIGGSLGVGYAYLAPSKYQASANIQVAKVAGADVEAPNILLEKLKMPMYYTQKTFTACGVLENKEPENAIAQSIKPVLLKGAPIISISYKDESTDTAKKCLESILNEIRTNQNALAKPVLEIRNNQLSNLKQKLDTSEKILKLLSSEKNISPAASSTLLLTTILSNENEAKDLRTQISDLEVLLAEPQTKEAFFTTPIYAPSARVEPNRSRIVLLSGIAGGVLAIAYLLGRRVWLKIKIPNKAI